MLSSGDLHRARDALASARRVTVFTGAGVSRSAGIPTFRDDDGLWQRFPPERFATPAGLAIVARTEPLVAAQFLAFVLRPVVTALPTPGHRAICAIEHQVPSGVVITQNVDGLHQSAGSVRVMEIHGSLLHVVDNEGQTVEWLERTTLARVVAGLDAALARRDAMAAHAALEPFLDVNPKTGQLRHRPSLVLFGEGMPEPTWSHAVDRAAQTEVWLSVGTSGAVYPAASLPERAHAHGAFVVGVGPDEGDADLWIHGVADEVLPQLVSASTRTRQTD